MNGANGQGTTVGNLVMATQRWIHQPFTSTGDLGQWFLITGVVAISALIWFRILRSFGE